MALRVLLADESSTIKKVIQLALQDYGVEVKSVPIGLDVLPVSKSFQPDLILVDVLLQKKSGYEVAKDLKEDPATQSIPVVLMWSSFMEIDEAKAQASRAEKRLEKPFDADILRQIVKDLVPRSLENRISSYLTFPKLPDFADEAPTEAVVNRPEPEDVKPLDLGTNTSDEIFAIPEADENELPELVLEPEDEFSNVPLSATTGPQLGPEESWSHQDLTQLKAEETGPAEAPLAADLDKYMIPAEELNLAQVESSGEFEEITFAPKTAPPKPAAPKPPPPTASKSAMDELTNEKIIRQEAQVAIEKILWQILPDICERVVREELAKLLKDTEKSI